MYWNNRLIRRIENDEVNLYMVEVYYNEDDDSIIGWTENETVWTSEEYGGVKSLRQSLTWMLEALDKPVLDEVELIAQCNSSLYESDL